ncbi:uncharacterized protein J3D65DRAFT_177960 [Phyllosticta citribraziliensis]|uniref:Uncharacterized protein n=1 Tax=Phyllosticta citribraziliensis TaxID=989973 RepID=A0ABR1L211_9PEZI
MSSPSLYEDDFASAFERFYESRPASSIHNSNTEDLTRARTLHRTANDLYEPASPTYSDDASSQDQPSHYELAAEELIASDDETSHNNSDASRCEHERASNIASHHEHTSDDEPSNGTTRCDHERASKIEPHEHTSDASSVYSQLADDASSTQDATITMSPPNTPCQHTAIYPDPSVDYQAEARVLVNKILRDPRLEQADVQVLLEHLPMVLARGRTPLESAYMYHKLSDMSEDICFVLASTMDSRKASRPALLRSLANHLLGMMNLFFIGMVRPLHSATSALTNSSRNPSPPPPSTCPRSARATRSATCARSPAAPRSSTSASPSASRPETASLSTWAAASARCLPQPSARARAACRTACAPPTSSAPRSSTTAPPTPTTVSWATTSRPCAVPCWRSTAVCALSPARRRRRGGRRRRRWRRRRRSRRRAGSLRPARVAAIPSALASSRTARRRRTRALSWRRARGSGASGTCVLSASRWGGGGEEGMDSILVH